MGYISFAWFHSHQFMNQKPVWSQSAAFLIWCERALMPIIYCPSQTSIMSYISIFDLHIKIYAGNKKKLKKLCIKKNAHIFNMKFKFFSRKLEWWQQIAQKSPRTFSGCRNQEYFTWQNGHVLGLCYCTRIHVSIFHLFTIVKPVADS